MPLTPQSLEEKPYNVCLNCIHIGKKCDGPNFLAMSAERWCEWCKLRKEYLGWTSAHVAEMAGLSKVTVDRVMSGNVKDLRSTTMQAITKALVNGTWGQYPCAMSADGAYVDNPALVEKAENAVAQCHRLQVTIDTMTEDHRAELSSIRSEWQKKVDFLREQISFRDNQLSAKDKLLEERYGFIRRKDKATAWLSILLGLSVLIIITALVADALNPNIGFFWLG